MKHCVLLLVELPFFEDSYSSYYYVKDNVYKRISPEVSFQLTIKCLEEDGYRKVAGAPSLEEIFLQSFSSINVLVFNGDGEIKHTGSFQREA